MQAGGWIIRICLGGCLVAAAVPAPTSGAPRPVAKAPTPNAQRPAPSHWSFIPPKRPAVPRVKDAAWVRNPIDAFVLQKLEAKGLKPSPPADPRTLIRRVTFDLTGL